MIKMNAPSLALNSDDVPGPKYIMWQSFDVPRGSEAQWTVQQIINSDVMARAYQNSPLQNVVINCHGDDGSLAIGGRGTGGGHINISNVAAFAAPHGRNIGTIWLVACDIAQTRYGRDFCQAMSVYSGSQVVGADVEQDVGVWGGYRLLAGLHGQIDEFEGVVYSFTPVGGTRVIDPHADIYTIKE